MDEIPIDDVIRVMRHSLESLPYAAPEVRGPMLESLQRGFDLVMHEYAEKSPEPAPDARGGMPRRTVTYAGITVPVLGHGIIGWPQCECGRRITFLMRDAGEYGNRYAVHGFDPDADRAIRCLVSLERYAQLAEHFAEVYRRGARTARIEAARAKREGRG